MSEMKAKIFILISCRYGNGEVSGYALAEDGTSLSGHYSGNESWFKHDMGLTSDWKHEKYAEHYPDGYELEYVASPDTHDEFKAAYALNKAQGEAVSQRP